MPIKKKHKEPDRIKRLEIILIVIIGLTLSLRLVIPVLRLGSIYHIDYNEGWNAYHTLHALSGTQLYQDNLTPLNYPPLSFFIVGAVSKVLGDIIVTGRIISLLSLFVIGLLTLSILRSLKADLFISIFSGFYVVCLIAGLAVGYVGMNDPQLLANAIMVLGLVVYLRKSDNYNFLTSLLICLALFTKHNILALPVAITIDLLLTDKRKFFYWIVYCSSIILGFLIATEVLSGGILVRSLLLKREYNIILLRYYIPSLVIISPLVIGVVGFVRNKLVILYLLFSLAIGLSFGTGSGTDMNIFFDTFISLSLGTGLLLKQIGTERIYKSILLLISAHVIFIIGVKMFIQRDLQLNYKDAEVIMKNDIAVVKDIPGNALCEKIDICYYAGKPFVYDPFIVDEMILSGQLEEQEVLKLIESKYFSVIQLDIPLSQEYVGNTLPYTLTKRKNLRFTENILRAIWKNYKEVRTSSNGAYYIPF